MNNAIHQQANGEPQIILQTKALHTWFPVRGGIWGRVQNYVRAVQDVSLCVEQGQIFSLVGESGCGKSTLGNSILGLVAPTAGELFLNGMSIDISKPKSWRPYRKQFQMVFQNPNASLNPRSTIFESLRAPIVYHKICSPKQVKDRIAYYLQIVGLEPDYMHRFPHSFSGGQKQRIAIARALAVEPKLIVCDEITSALDVSVQAQILQLVLDLQKQFNLSLLFVSHDLSVVRHISDRIAVMYLGKIVEQGLVDQIFNSPAHPYTRALLDSIPTMNIHKPPVIVKGEVPDALHLPKGCYFAGRCSYAQEKCHYEYPDRQPVACFYPLQPSSQTT